MQKRKIAIVLFCIVSTLAMSSCVKKTLETVTTPIVAAAKTVGTCVRATFNMLRLRGCKAGRTAHVHKRKFCEAPERK